TLPEISSQRFSSWFKIQVSENHQKNVVLFNDTFTEFNQPEVGKAAVKVLNALKYNVIIPKWSCCGRPLLSKGKLEAARQKAVKLIKILMPYAVKGYAIIGLEPSCILTVIDDYTGLVGKSDPEILAMISTIRPLCTTFDEFIASHVDATGQLPLKFIENPQQVLVHGHCHQKSLVGMDKTMKMLKSLPGYTASEIPSGCCGMAGSFGYEKEHYDISMKIAALKLVPAIEAAPTTTEIIANGFSCRCQIDHTTGRKAVHLAEALANRLQ
nr:FAD-binding oxidoreductase [Parachlamydiaceae bacterium]